MKNNQQYREGFSENNGVKIFYRDYGPEDGDPVLMVHGLGAQLVHWQPHLISFLQDIFIFILKIKCHQVVYT